MPGDYVILIHSKHYGDTYNFNAGGQTVTNDLELGTRILEAQGNKVIHIELDQNGNEKIDRADVSLALEKANKQLKKLQQEGKSVKAAIIPGMLFDTEKNLSTFLDFKGSVGKELTGIYNNAKNLASQVPLFVSNGNSLDKTPFLGTVPGAILVGEKKGSFELSPYDDKQCDETKNYCSSEIDILAPSPKGGGNTLGSTAIAAGQYIKFEAKGQKVILRNKETNEQFNLFSDYRGN